MRVCHEVTAVFDDPNLVSCAGLAPVLQLAERAGLQRLVGEHLHLGTAGGVNAQLKVPALVAGMLAGADSIDDMDLLRHGAMGRLFAGVRAPSTLGTFLRAFTFGHVRQLDAVASRLLINLAGQAPLLAGAAELAHVDVDDTVKQTYCRVACLRSPTESKVPRRMACLVMIPKKISTMFSQEPEVGVKWSCTRGCLASQACTFGCLWVA